MPIIEIGLAFLEGVALIVSPCILPVLPLVLASSLDGARARPFGVIAGFVLAFTLFALLSRSLLSAFSIDPEVIGQLSLMLLASFGLIMLSERLSGYFSALTQGVAQRGSSLAAINGSGFSSGVTVGFLIGLVWTPCAGPILAAVLVQIIRQEDTFSSLFIIAAFGMGAGLPMLLIALLGRKLMRQLGFLSLHAVRIRRGLGVVILLTVALLATDTLPTTTAPQTQSIAQGAHPEGLIGGLAQPYQAPELAGINAWLNSPPLTLKSLRGRVVLIDFWAYSCINCVRTLPYVTQWDQQYRDKGLTIIGVHSPEFEFEKKQRNVEAAIAAHGIQYPVALDNQFDTWTAFANKYWPAHYLIDQEGHVVYRHFGEGSYDKMEHNIRHLLKLDYAPPGKEEARHTSKEQTAETYLGYERAARFANEKGYKNASFDYTLPQTLKTHEWGLSGSWNIEAERIVSAQADASLTLHFLARKVFLVLGAKEPTTLRIRLNGKDMPPVNVSQHTLYELVSQPNLQSGLLEITADKPGLEAYAFTFGSK